MVTVLVVMLVLSIGGLALATIITSTTVSLSNSNSRAQAQAAVDAGIATETAKLENGTHVCGAGSNTYSDTEVPVNSANDPSYDYRLGCAAGVATLEVFSEVGGSRVGREATFTYTVASTPGAEGDIVMYGGDITFTTQVNAGTASRPVEILIPNGSFTCQNTIWGTVVAKYDVRTNGGCTVHGDLTSTDGRFSMSNSPDLVTGNVIAGGSGAATSVQGRIDGSLHTNHGVNFGWSGHTYGGPAIVNGPVSLGSMRLPSLTKPAGQSYEVQSGWVGTLSQPAAVPAPTLPPLIDWFEYRYQESDWPGYNIVTLTSGGSNSTPGTCSYFNAWPSNGWTVDLNSITNHTVIDARACGNLSANAGMSPVVDLKHNLVLLANSFDMTNLTFRAASDAPTGENKPSLWFITEDRTPADHKPTCGSGQNSTSMNHFKAEPNIKTMVYSACGIGFSGNNSVYNGVLYGGNWTGHGAGINYTPDVIGLPGMSSAGSGGSGGGSAGPPVFSLSTSRTIDWQNLS
jgi:type II secretory pathway pseudopilin PulG